MFCFLSRKASFIIKSFSLMAILTIIAIIAIAAYYDDLKTSQKQIILDVEIKNKVNICLPEDEEFFEKSFFDF